MRKLDSEGLWLPLKKTPDANLYNVDLSIIASWPLSRLPPYRKRFISLHFKMAETKLYIVCQFSLRKFQTKILRFIIAPHQAIFFLFLSPPQK